jgi:predicted cupin superfamily sugar epimerase
MAADVGGRAEGERLADLLGLQPLPDEGGRYRRTFADAHSSAIYFLLLAPDFSALHRLAATETYHWYAGSPLRLLLLHDDGEGGGRVDEPTLGPGFDAGERPQIVVPAGTWQGSSPMGPGRSSARRWHRRSRGRASALASAPNYSTAGRRPRPGSWR